MDYSDSRVVTEKEYMITVIVTDIIRDTTLAQAELGSGALEFEGYYYFDRDKVNMENLVVTDRIYNCPYKGDAYWIDLKDRNDRVRPSVAWIYENPKPGYGHIKDKIGFYPGNRVAAGTRATKGYS
jgi:uncharacterized protein (DUF427 family)